MSAEAPRDERARVVIFSGRRPGETSKGMVVVAHGRHVRERTRNAALQARLGRKARDSPSPIVMVMMADGGSASLAGSVHQVGVSVMQIAVE